MDHSSFLTKATDTIQKFHAFNVPVYVRLSANEFVSQACDFFLETLVEIVAVNDPFILYRLLSQMQLLRMDYYPQVFYKEMEVVSILKEHLGIRRTLRVISNMFRAFILLMLVFVTATQLAALLRTLRSSYDGNIYKAGELALCSIIRLTWAKPMLEDGKLSDLLDQSISLEIGCHKIEGMVLYARKCIRCSPKLRPHISIILKLLHGDPEVTSWEKQQVLTQEVHGCMDDDLVGGKLSALKSHIEGVKSTCLFEGADFKLASCHQPANDKVAKDCCFTFLSIRIVEELVILTSHTLLNPPEVLNAGKHLSAHDLNSILHKAVDQYSEKFKGH